jgi:hypothetical protein
MWAVGVETIDLYFAHAYDTERPQNSLLYKRK